MTTVLAYRFSAFGDVAMTVPVFREILEQNPGLKIVMASRKNFSELFEGIPNLEFVGVDVDSYKGFAGMWRLSNELILKIKPNLIADLHDVIRTKMLDAIFRSKGYKVYKINKGKEEKEHLTDVWNLDKIQLKSTPERYADVYREMGFPVKLSHQLRPVTFIKNGIGFAPFARHKGKMLPIEKSYEIAKVLAKQQKLYFFGGGKNESEILQSWESLIPNTESLAGKLTLRQELEKISTLYILISMDSANMHLASLVGTRCLSVWCQTHPFAGFLGYGQSMEDVIQQKDLTCRPCSVFGDKECYRGDWACIEEFPYREILEKLSAIAF